MVAGCETSYFEAGAEVGFDVGVKLKITE